MQDKTKPMITPLGKRLILRPNASEVRGFIFIPHQLRDNPTSCKVIARGKDVNPLIKDDDVVFCKVGLGNRNAGHFERSRDFWANEDDVYAVLRYGTIFPFGQKVLIRRDMADEYHGSIVIPENRRYQSLTGTIERIAVSRKPLRVAGLSVGLKIRLHEWNESMVEVELEDGGYGLIVNDTDLLYAIDN